jgi:Rho-binding antiterminator
MSEIQKMPVTGKTYATAADASGLPAKYHPISCEFHDLLETHATARKPAQIHFRDEEGAVHFRSAAITDVYARQGAEYLAMSTGETLRLDQLIEVNGAKLADYTE